MGKLAAQPCVPCRKGTSPLSMPEIQTLLSAIPAWQLVESEGIPRLQRVYPFKNFRQALAFTNQIGELAEAENHHPAILTEWGQATVTWWTHVIRGLHRNDFIMAARCDQLYQQHQHP